MKLTYFRMALRKRKVKRTILMMMMMLRLQVMITPQVMKQDRKERGKSPREKPGIVNTNDSHFYVFTATKEQYKNSLNLLHPKDKFWDGLI